MKPSDFSYELPAELIAQTPLAQRESSRLLHVPVEGDFRELRFAQLGTLLQPGDLLVLNDTRVIPARLIGRKASGGHVEMLLERILEPELALVQLRSSRSPKVGAELTFEPGIDATVEGRQGTFFVLRFQSDIADILDEHGHVPLPPYISREDEPVDRDRYQTVYAQEPGAVAAPTAGLHFSNKLLQALQSAGTRVAEITLHVGAGTFLPLRPDQLEAGRLHEERIEVGAEVCGAVERTREQGGRVIAVGTTVVRALESAVVDGVMRPFSGETDIFIRPGYKFSVVDAMITNFHLPESSLLMLVSAFHGTDAILRAYRYAVDQRFRFFSYGDAMFLEKRT
ncbi:MAG: tRNA preQ1(34) S-adenosylmethionine ribosyltransferase-isomerase QueA [Gammaproteobacteria bacterium]|jgi:S-adenosylmethionine:tRNA ribosyltransferase-isomerase|nr:tRNA preQ1(34) S-adenosylmethionine ribosyltransferase-isomerase QueA [Gammaproteobacteria bacterium]MDP6616295.1 tRNA preQ1(34) S-adenosylmethionine ribosyltransferase-isomerase QueA [Gammaproteobacteria bacterium]MDP6694009.1 tRNA preQ1(34) S-adenosylmethionine ribosyltransferase-isomerase QueA [Gammaproteobacteria bacterium]